MKYLSFADWKANELVSRPFDMLVGCINCNATGQIKLQRIHCTPEDFDECFDEYEYGTCSKCEGDAQLEWGALEEGEQLILLNENAYLETLRSDIHALSRFYSKPLHELAFQLNLAPFSELYFTERPQPVLQNGLNWF